MKIRDFVYELAQSTKDNNMMVIPAEEWVQILNSQASELAPEVLFEHVATINWETAPNLNKTSYEIDLSDTTNYEGIDRVKKVYLVDSNSERFEYDNWVFDKAAKILRLDPATYASPDRFPSGNYPNIAITWLGYIPVIQGDDSIEVSRGHIGLLKKVCLREALNRILMDHTKLDRYRTLVGRMNEYVLIAMARDLGTEVAASKGKLSNSNSVRTF
jgi:hypothetical protein